MRDIANKNIGDFLSAETFNANFISELLEVVTSAGFTLDPELGPDTDLSMLVKSLVIYSVASSYFAESGAANNYILTRSGGLEPLPSYVDGMTVIFKPTNDNSGASVINIDSIGSKDLVASDGSALTGGEIKIDQYVIARYRGGTDDFEVVFSDGGLMHLAGPETATGSKTISTSGAPLTLNRSAANGLLYLQKGGVTGGLLGTDATDIIFYNGSSVERMRLSSAGNLTVSGATFNDAQVADIDLIAGINWALRTSAADNDWQSVCYGNGMFVAVAITGTGNRVMSSPDGINWSSQTSAANNSWNSVCYGNGLFVAVSYTGTGNRVMTSPDGIVWTSRTSAADYSWSSVTYGNGLFVAVGYSGTGDRVMTSSDGITWTLRTSAADNAWTAVAYGNGVFVAVAATGAGDRVMSSPDGINWTLRTSAADNEWYSVTYGNGLFVAISRSGSGNRVMTSPDGITWTIRTSAANYSWFGVTYGNGLFVAVSYGGVGNRVMSSPDGINWTLRTSAADNSWRDVCYGNGIFISVAASGTGDRVMTSGKEIEHLELDPDHSHTHIAGQEILTAADIIESTFTPTIEGSTAAGTGTYTAQTGYYQKIGNWVHFRIRIAWTAHTGTGSMRVANLPLTSNADGTATVPVLMESITFSGSYVDGLIPAAATYIGLYGINSGAGVSAVAISNGGSIHITGSYQA